MVNPVGEVSHPEVKIRNPLQELCNDAIAFLDYMRGSHLIWKAAFHLLEKHPLSQAAFEMSPDGRQKVIDTLGILNNLHIPHCPDHFKLVESESPLSEINETG